MDAVALSDRGGMQGDVEDETSRARERRGIAAGLVMLLQDQRLEALTGEGRGAA